MSEFINNSEKRVESLFQFSQGILRGEDGTKLLAKHGEALKYITPHDMIAMEEKQLRMGVKPGAIKDKIEKVMNAIYDHLNNYEWDKPEEGHALYYLMQENRELENILNELKQNLKDRAYKVTKINVSKLLLMEHHYLRKENILFPFLEKVWENCLPLVVMWSLHDDIRMKLKQLLSKLSESEDFTTEIFTLIGEVFFMMYGMIFKEELVIYPVAMETLTAVDWNKIYEQSFDIGYSFITPPEVDKPSLDLPEVEEKISGAFFQTKTGGLNQQQLEVILNTIPLDLTFIDENDEVRYFSNPKDRFFPRSPAIIGRKVQKCHPPESVHIVEKILDSFKAGLKDEASFHIQMKGKFIQICYFAIRDENGKYLGTLEVGQDVTDIKDLEGEKRLLDWNE
jgi:uncharacterized protein